MEFSVTMASYLKWWRKTNAQVDALAQDSISSGSTEEQDNSNAVDESTSFHAEVSDEVRPIAAGNSDHNTHSEIGSTDHTTDTSSDSEIEESGNSGNTDIRQDLAEWASKHNCTRSILNELLYILCRHGHNSLPADGRTLLQTPRNVDVLYRCGGQYAYFGTEKGILHILGQKSHVLKENTISLQLNTDGIPLFKSNNEQLWPMMCNLNQGPIPFIVEIFCGTAKPKPVKEYIVDFLKEVHKLTVDGIRVEDKVYNVSIDGFCV